MKIAILGYGVEGQSLEAYFKKQGAEVVIYDDFLPEDLDQAELSTYDHVFRSPSVSPHQLPSLQNLTTATQYFFSHCPAPIIGVTGTKGKGTTCSLITSLLQAFGEKTWLVGNIGKSAISVLSRIKESDIVIFELSSFQLWDLAQSPHVSVVLRVEPDHLNVHADFADYVSAKANIARHQSAADYCIYYRQNPDSVKIAKASPGTLIPYPAENDKLRRLIAAHLHLPGEHNVENAEAAIAAVASFYGADLETFLRSRNNTAKLQAGLESFQGLPHRIEFIRELNNVKYYDDNYSSAFPALDVALKTFESQPTILIAGGINKGTDEAEIRSRIFSSKNLIKAILIGETKEILSEKQDPHKYICAETLESAVATARSLAEDYADDGEPVVVLMSPGHASFDMFKNFSDRGEQYTKLVKKLK